MSGALFSSIALYVFVLPWFRCRYVSIKRIVIGVSSLVLEFCFILLWDFF